MASTRCRFLRAGAGVDGDLPWAVLMAALGGIAVFGIDGFVLGPAIAAMFIAVWHIHGSTRPEPNP